MIRLVGFTSILILRFGWFVMISNIRLVKGTRVSGETRSRVSDPLEPVAFRHLGPSPVLF